MSPMLKLVHLFNWTDSELHWLGLLMCFCTATFRSKWHEQSSKHLYSVSINPKLSQRAEWKLWTSEWLEETKASLASLGMESSTLAIRSLRRRVDNQPKQSKTRTPERRRSREDVLCQDYGCISEVTLDVLPCLRNPTRHCGQDAICLLCPSPAVMSATSI